MDNFDLDKAVLSIWHELLRHTWGVYCYFGPLASELTLFELLTLSKNEIIAKLLDKNRRVCIHIPSIRCAAGLNKTLVHCAILSHVPFARGINLENLNKTTVLSRGEDLVLSPDSSYIMTTDEKEKLVKVLNHLVSYDLEDAKNIAKNLK